MKKIILYIALCFPLWALVSCDLDTNPTTQVSGDGMFKSDKTAAVALNGIYRSMYTSDWTTTGNTHQCFGISAYNIMADVMGEDMIMASQGSGWFWFDCVYTVKDAFASKAFRPYDLWTAYNKWVADANYIIASADQMEGETDNVNNVVGQAYAIRAYSYHYLASIFSRTYVGHESDPCVPIYTEPTLPSTQGKPRSTVQEVYDLVLADIDKAIELLEPTKDKNVHKSNINYYVANGFKARIALVINDWKSAAQSAKIARERYEIYEGEDLLKGMNDVAMKNVLWGAEIVPDQSGVYASFFAHLDATVVDKEGKPVQLYANSAPKLINKQLYALMGDDDVRRAWWDTADKSTPYIQRKFSFKNSQQWTGDYIWMRAEEMLLTEAEAECRLGNDAGARKLLTELMQGRDSNYDVSKKSGTALGKLTSDRTGSLLEEILTQRRIELWGEIGRVYDIKRLKQGFTRTEVMGWPKDALLDKTNTQNPETYAWVMTIPQAEFDGNESLDSKVDQNPIDDGI